MTRTVTLHIILTVTLHIILTVTLHIILTVTLHIIFCSNASKFLDFGTIDIFCLVLLILCRNKNKLSL